MAKSMKKIVGCPSCGALEEAVAYPSVTIPTDRSLRDAILEETLFLWQCSACGYEVSLSYPCLYQDAIRKFLLYVQPEDAPDDLLPQLPLAGLEHLRKRCVSDVEELKEKLLIFEADLNDYAIELVKTALTQVVAAKWGITPQKSFFCGINREKNTLEYVFYLNEEEQPVYQTIKTDAYTASLEIISNIITNEPNTYLRVDSATAQTILQTHQQQSQTSK